MSGFSELPASSFFRISDKLFLLAYTPREYILATTHSSSVPAEGTAFTFQILFLEMPENIEYF